MASGSMDLGATSGAFTPSGAAGGDLSGNYPNPTVVSAGGGTGAFAAGAVISASELVTGSGGIAFLDPHYTSPVMNIGAAGTGGSVLVNIPSLNSSFNSGLSIDGTYGTPDLTAVVTVRSFGPASAGGYCSRLNLQTTNGSVSTTGLSINENAIAAVPQGIIVSTSGSQPSAAVAYRGMLFVVQGAGGVADKLQVCLKSAGDSYSWKDIVSG